MQATSASGGRDTTTYTVEADMTTDDHSYVDTHEVILMDYSPRVTERWVAYGNVVIPETA